MKLQHCVKSLEPTDHDQTLDLVPGQLLGHRAVVLMGRSRITSMQYMLDY